MPKYLMCDPPVQTVVLLTPLTEDFAVFWPVKHEEYDLDYFKVRCTLYAGNQAE